jgi:trans-aconitate 2-methyltransferase
MASWSPETYLTFANERSRPFLDLVARIPIAAKSIVDLGCGPGHLMPILRSRWPAAVITGIDSSPEMIAQAKSNHLDPSVRYLQQDIAAWESASVDLLISNAAFQWIPGHLSLLPALAESVNPGGAFAFQVPDNFSAPSHTLLRSIAEKPAYFDHLQDVAFVRQAGITAADYLEIFEPAEWTVDAWETTYLHVLQGTDPVFDWISGTGARPVLQALPDNLRPAFVAEFKAALREAYLPGRHGTVFPFRRVFVVAIRRD